MKLSVINMIKKVKYIAVCIILFFAVNVHAQNTTNSPYSQFGLGDIKPALIAQNIGMGGLAMGIRKAGGYNNINVANPAAYSAINLSTFDIGATIDFRTLSKSSMSERTTNGTLSHLLIAIPVNPKSALSFGLMPYSDLGYQYRTHKLLEDVKVDQVYAGEGGLSRAHLGYGYQVAKNLSLGFNMAYIFGNLKNKQSTEFPEDITALSSRNQAEKSVGGFNFQYGIQYVVNPEGKNVLTIGYSGTTSSKLNTNGSMTSFRYSYDAINQTESAPIDTIYFNPEVASNMRIPQTHSIGFAFERANKWVMGADFTYSRWSQFSEGGVNAGLNDSFGIAVGGQYTPDYTAVSNYFKLIDYSLGVRFNKTYMKVQSQQINQTALCFGLGLPLPSNRTAFYKINFAAEWGKRGTLSNNLVRENYLNLRLGFTLNDRWFIKPKYD
jgi:long-subunit fatty acid transport protein